MNNENLPIGVFDSGIGGLTVLNALVKAMPQESFLYLGDTARLPYGCKSAETISQYAIQAADVLLKRGIKCLVLACNTVSARALPILTSRYGNLPVIGVVEPGAQAALRVSAHRPIVVLATESTVESNAYYDTIKKMHSSARIIQKSCGLLVALVEEALITGDITQAVIRHYLQSVLMQEQQPGCVLLGCTHFPVLAPAIKSILPEDIHVVDSAQTTAEYTKKNLRALNLIAQQQSGTVHYMVTDAPQRFQRVAQNFIDLPISVDNVELIDLISTLQVKVAARDAVASMT
jgi:glutamate racemase